MRFFLLAAAFFSSAAMSQNLNNGWALIGIQEDGTRYGYHAGSMVKDNFPPNIITTKIATYDKSGKTNGYEQLEVRCQQQEIKFGNNPFVNISSDTKSVRKMILRGLCGVNQTNGHWFLVGTIPGESNQGSEIPPLSTYYFIDVKSIKKTSKPIPNGTSLLYHFGLLNENKAELWEVTGTPSELVIDCGDDSHYYHPKETDKLNYDKLKTGINTVPQAINHLVCNGYYSLDQAKKASSIQAKDFSEVKKQCLELGFKQGTESFGKCVLTLSK
jgi:hypothetical protein